MGFPPLVACPIDTHTLCPCSLRHSRSCRDVGRQLGTYFFACVLFLVYGSLDCSSLSLMIASARKKDRERDTRHPFSIKPCPSCSSLVPYLIRTSLLETCTDSHTSSQGRSAIFCAPGMEGRCLCSMAFSNFCTFSTLNFSYPFSPTTLSFFRSFFLSFFLSFFFSFFEGGKPATFLNLTSALDTFLFSYSLSLLHIIPALRSLIPSPSPFRSLFFLRRHLEPYPSLDNVLVSRVCFSPIPGSWDACIAIF